jgi:hypothetical protein
MDNDAARRARRQRFKANLADAYTDEEAQPPEWLDLQNAIAKAKTELRGRIDAETERFATEPDIRRAIAGRERATDELRRRIDGINGMVRRLNLVAPLPRFSQPGLDADELLRPLYRTPRKLDA